MYYSVQFAVGGNMVARSNYCQHGCLLKAKVLREHLHRLLTIICKSFSKKKPLQTERSLL